MKTRSGFVSNSSSSSFIVIREDYLGKNKTKFITPKEEKILVKYGFKKVTCFYPDQVPIEFYYDPKPKSKSYMKMLKKITLTVPEKKANPYFNYGYDLTCNQDDVIYFLLKNNISFSADCHYGHYTVIFDKGEKEFLQIQNPGKQALSGSWRGKNSEIIKNAEFGSPVIERVNVKNWMKKEEAWQRDLNDQLPLH